MASRAKEDYLKVIYELEEKVGIAKTSQLAGKLGVKAATVTEMIQRLSKEAVRTITYKRHQGARLTPEGREQAMGIVRKHRLLETFLYRTLGLSWDEVHEEAEVLEHHISSRVTEAIDRHLEFPRFDPHGEPIPDAGGKLTPLPRLPLSEIETGNRFMIVGVNPISGEFLAQLDGLGMGIGTTGRLLTRDAENATWSVELDSRNNAPHTNLTRYVTESVYVEII